MTMLTTDGATVTGAPQSASGGIRRIPRERTTPRAAKKENTLQLPLGLALIVVVVAIGVYIAVSQNSLVLGINWYIGVLLGLALQRSRFCFTAAFRDPCLTGGTGLSKAVIVALAAATAIFAALQLGAIVKTPDPAAAIAAAMKIGGFEPVGIHTAVGAILFGLGAVIAGGCASGTLMRMGEGFAQQWIVIPFFVIGSALGAASFPVWKEMLAVDPKRVVYLPQILGGFLPALVVQFAALLCVYLLASWWTKRKASASH
jgi:hypothetical protein